MQLIRFSVSDPSGAVSFCGPCHAIKMLVAGCSRGARSVEELLNHLAGYDEAFAAQITNGLSIFDEHNVPGNTAAIERVLGETDPLDWPPFRVLSAATRDASTRCAGAGLIIFNLGARRIVQVQNSYSEILRRDRGRLREQGRPVQRLYHYELPSEWSLVP